MNHLRRQYPLDPYSNALRLVGNNLTIEQNMALISKHQDASEKMTQYRDEIYEGWVAEHGDQAESDGRDLTGTTVSIMGSVLNEDGSADIIIGVDMVSPNVAWLSKVFGLHSLRECL